MQEQVKNSTELTIEVIEKLVPIYEEIALLGEDAKSILSDAKEAGLDSSNITKVAKAKAADKLGDLTEKTETLMELIEAVS